MKPTSPPSAGTTTSTDGQPATDRNSAITSEELDELNESLKGLKRLELPSRREYLWWKWTWQWRRLIHPLGFHMPLEAEDWDLKTGSVKYIGRRCLICDAEC